MHLWYKPIWGLQMSTWTCLYEAMFPCHMAQDECRSSIDLCACACACVQVKWQRFDRSEGFKIFYREIKFCRRIVMLFTSKQFKAMRGMSLSCFLFFFQRGLSKLNVSFIVEHRCVDYSSHYILLRKKIWAPSFKMMLMMDHGLTKSFLSSANTTNADCGQWPGRKERIKNFFCFPPIWPSFDMYVWWIASHSPLNYLPWAHCLEIPVIGPHYRRCDWRSAR